MKLERKPALPVWYKSNNSQRPKPIGQPLQKVMLNEGEENTENYLNHTTFGLLYRVCQLENKQELFTSVYAMRIFFLVTYSSTGMTLEPITRTVARQSVESRLRNLRRLSQLPEYEKLQAIYRQTFE